ncbi:MAG: hypothetical protein A2W35_01460 [Chloroflexi bacterium RBG_16_57_11]|nr:MAG: hypothetical protein A2W35_01460 [Chloroflexi bacterium RBG_16_57_11]
MTETDMANVFLSYSPETEDFVEGIARKLFGDARLTFWFRPWHSQPGKPVQEQMEDALYNAQAIAVFVGGAEGVEGWQNEQMRVAIQTRVEDDPAYRVIPVLLPGAHKPARRGLPALLRRYEMVEFREMDDPQAFQRLLAGVLGLPPIDVEGYVQERKQQQKQQRPPEASFVQGHALLVGIANYLSVRSLPESVLNDARATGTLLADPAACGYPAGQVQILLDEQAIAAQLRHALKDLANHTGAGDTAIFYFSGHGFHKKVEGGHQQFLLPYDADLADPASLISGEEMTDLLRQIRASRLLVLFDSCHSGGVGDPKSAGMQLKAGLDEQYYERLATGKGRVILASSRPEEPSWVLEGMDNSVFTHYLLEALRGYGPSLGDGYIRVFDLFRHVSEKVPSRAKQHPIFKATAMEEDFVVALARPVG